MRAHLLLGLSVAGFLVSGCYEPRFLGVIAPDGNCKYETDGDLVKDAVLDVGPTEALTHSYEAVLLLEGRPGDEVTSASVGFQDANDEDLPDVEYNGETVVFPNFEGERVEDVEGTIGDDGLGAVPFTIVTKKEAAPMQELTAVGEDLELRIEVRAVVGGADTDVPANFELRVCQLCLVGVGAAEEDGDLVCPDGESPTPVEDAPCREGQDDVFSTCSDA